MLIAYPVEEPKPPEDLSTFQRTKHFSSNGSYIMGKAVPGVLRKFASDIKHVWPIETRLERKNNVLDVYKNQLI